MPGRSRDTVSTGRYIGFLLAPAVGTFAFNAVTVMLPTLRAQFAADATGLMLVVAGYGIPFAVLLILGGRLGDRFGRHRLFVAGMSLLAVASVGCAFAPTIEVLIAARVVQGVGAALCTPQVLATIQATSHGLARTRAIAAFGASAGVGSASGQVLGGALAASTGGPLEGWRSVFLLVAVLAGAAVALSPLAPRSRAHEKVVIDLVGTATLGVGILAAAIAFTFAPVGGWSWPVPVLLAVAGLAFVAMWRHQDALERSGKRPLLPPSLLRRPALRRGLVAVGLFFAGYSALLFVVPRAVEVEGLTSRETGLALLPFALVYAALSLAVARVQKRLGEAALIVGVALQIAALLGMAATVALAWGPAVLWWLQPSLVVLGAAQALIFAPLTSAVVREVPAEAAGLSGGLLGTAQQLALSVGVIAIGGVVTLTGVTGRAELIAGLVVDIALAVIVLALAVLLGRRPRVPERARP